MIPDELLQRIDDETDIVALVSEYVSLEQKGKNYMGLCPFHDEKTPSFSVSTEKNIAMCMGCRQGGRPINFLRLIKNIPLNEAALILADRLGIELNIKTNKRPIQNIELYEMMEDATNFFEINLFNSVSGESVLEYLKKRNLDTETIKHFRLGFASKDKDQLYQYLKSKDYNVSDMIKLGLVKQASDGSYYDLFNNRLMFPITNGFGKVVGFSGRTLSKSDNVKYVNSPETPIFKKGEILYHISEASLDIRRLKHVILYEGFFDVIASYQAGITNGIATMGTALTTNQANSIKKTVDHVIIAYDGDNAGINASISAIPTLSKANLKVEVLSLPDKMDPDDYIKLNGSEAYITLLKDNVKDPYQFQFDYYVSISDLSNSNDIKELELKIGKMLSNASAAIVSIYKEKLSKLLNISVEDLNLNIKTNNNKTNNNTNYNNQQFNPGSYQQEPNIPPEDIYDSYDYQPYEPNTTNNIEYNINNKKDNINNILPENNKDIIELDDRFINSEKILIILMIRSKDWHDELENTFKTTEYAHPLLGVIRTKLSAHYNFNDVFDLVLFKEELNYQEHEYFESKIQTDPFWINQTKISEEEIRHYVAWVKSAVIKRRIKHLKDVMKEKSQKGQSFVLENEEFVELMKEMSKLQEDLINNG